MMYNVQVPNALKKLVSGIELCTLGLVYEVYNYKRYLCSRGQECRVTSPTNFSIFENQIKSNSETVNLNFHELNEKLG